MNIPVVGLVSNGGDDTIRFVEAIDHPVDELIVVFDGCEGEHLPSNPMVGKTTPLRVPGKIGPAACWNLVIKARMNSPNWLLAVEGVRLSPGLIGDFSSALDRDPSPGIVHASSGDFSAGCWDLFLIGDDIVGIMGLFDENLLDWEFAGADYLMRTVHRPIKKTVSLGRDYGNAPAPYNEKLSIKNHAYLTKKWGNWSACDPMFNPFGNPDFAVGYFPFIVGV
jgi:hypothetical protein